MVHFLYYFNIKDLLITLQPDGEELQTKIKEKVNEILSTSEFDKARSSKMDIDDFLKLLSAFNAAGIHFT